MPVPSFSSSVAEIHLDALKHNLLTIKKSVSPKTPIAAVVKANAYGHGAIEVTKELLKEGVHFFCVARVEEAIQLRQAGISEDILVFTPPTDSTRSAYLSYNLIATISDFPQFEKTEKGMRVHINIDTGMGRLGILYYELEKLAEYVRQYEQHVSIEGIYSHFSDAEAPTKDLTQEQVLRFDEVIRHFSGKKWLVHQANSAATAMIPAAHRQMVRAGISLYGYDEGFSFNEPLKAVMHWKAALVEVRRLPANWPISYGATYHTKEAGYVGVLAVGYADGLNRALSGKVQFANSAKGDRYNQIGRITMDHCMVWLGQNELALGTSFDILNGKADNAKKWAAELNTIPYEVVCAVSSRVQRIYK